MQICSRVSCPTLVDEELVLAGVVHPLADVPVEEGVGVVPLHRPQLLPQAEPPAADLRPRARQAPAADVGDDGPQGVCAQLLDVAREVEAGAVEQLRLLLRQRAPVKEGRSFSSFVEDCPKSRQLVCICILGLPFPGGTGKVQARFANEGLKIPQLLQQDAATATDPRTPSASVPLSCISFATEIFNFKRRANAISLRLPALRICSHQRRSTSRRHAFSVRMKSLRRFHV